jgi:hypothetical protein
MSELTVITNNVPRDIIEAYELSARERAKFDYLDWQAIERGEDSASFFRFKGDIYDLGEFERWSGPAFSPLAKWDGHRSDTFFSGLVVRYCDDHERIIVGRFYS